MLVTAVMRPPRWLSDLCRAVRDAREHADHLNRLATGATYRVTTKKPHLYQCDGLWMCYGAVRDGDDLSYVSECASTPVAAYARLKAVLVYGRDSPEAAAARSAS